MGELCLLDVPPDDSVEQFGEGVPGRGHSDGNRKGDGCKHKRSGPHSGAVNAAGGEEFKDDEDQQQAADADHGSGSGRQSDAVPREAAEGRGDQSHGGDQDETLVRVGPAPGAPCCEDDHAKDNDADQRNGKRNSGVERADFTPR